MKAALLRSTTWLWVLVIVFYATFAVAAILVVAFAALLMSSHSARQVAALAALLGFLVFACRWTWKRVPWSTFANLYVPPNR
jgi:membrane protease YdiL (CAAX protease family)